MPEMLLLGAGASIEAGIPAAYKMTNEILNRLKNHRASRTEARVLSFIVGGLLFNFGRNGDNPLESGVNVEDAFNAIQLISERNSSESAPFIGSWHSFIDEIDKKYEYTPSVNLKKVIYEAISKEVGEALSRLPSSYNYQAVDRAVDEFVSRKIQSASKGGNNGGISNIGKSIEGYIKTITGEWNRNLRNRNLSGLDSIEREIEKIISRNKDKPGEGAIFARTNELMLALLKDLVYTYDRESVNYMSSILRLLDGQGGLTIATLNYDNVIELLANSYNVSVNDGISNWHTTGEVELKKEGINLLKIHGSIDWAIATSDNATTRRRRSSLSPYYVVKVDSGKIKDFDFKPALIFGGKNKLTAEGPFLDLLRAFNTELKRHETLTIIGYSFRDPHINVHISRWLSSNPNAVVRIINGPSFVSDVQAGKYPEFAYDLLNELSSQVEVVEQYAGNGVSQIYGERMTMLKQIEEEVDIAFNKALDTSLEEDLDQQADQSQEIIPSEG